MRLDQYLLLKHSVRSRTQAKDLIDDGHVMILDGDEWRVETRTSFKCPHGLKVKILKPENLRWVARSGKKLLEAYERLEIDLSGKTVLDIGQSTGGFTQASLIKGAEKVVGVDVGVDQLAESLLNDQRVESFEAMDARELTPDITGDFDLVVMDVSFISVTKVLSKILDLCKGKEGLILIKPQFEVGKSLVGKGGLVKKSEVHLKCQKGVLEEFDSLGFKVHDYFPVEVKGKDGNQEFFCYISM